MASSAFIISIVTLFVLSVGTPNLSIHSGDSVIIKASARYRDCSLMKCPSGTRCDAGRCILLPIEDPNVVGINEDCSAPEIRCSPGLRCAGGFCKRKYRRFRPRKLHLNERCTSSGYRCLLGLNCIYGVSKNI